MTFPSSFHMPGTWNSEGVHPGLFRPPVSPNASADYLVAPTFAKETGSRRKWSRRNNLQVHDMATNDGYVQGEGFLGGFSTGPESRPYALAGRLSTSTMGLAMEDNGHLGESMFSDSDYRRALGSKRSRDQMEASHDGPTTTLYNLPSKPAPVAGWGALAFSAIGDVVGRVWDFCRNGTFKGFSAGGGVGFELTKSGSFTQAKALPSAPAEDMFCFQAGPRQGEHAYDDGQRQTAFQAGRFWHEMPQKSSSGYATTGSPPAKRRQTEYKPELGKNWVMIREPGEAEGRKSPRKAQSPQWVCPQSRTQASPVTGASHFATPNTRRSVPAPASTPRRPAGGSASSRPASRVSEASSVKAQRPVSAASAASFASFTARASPAPVIVSKIPVRASPTATAPASMAPTTSPTQLSASTPTQMNSSRRRRHTAATAPSHSPPNRQRRANSAASLALNRAGTIDESDRLDDEARHLATRRKMEERETDVRMSAFNRRLQDMIRQGQEALNTTIEVDMMEGDEEAQGYGGWEDEL